MLDETADKVNMVCSIEFSIKGTDGKLLCYYKKNENACADGNCIEVMRDGIHSSLCGAMDALQQF